MHGSKRLVYALEQARGVGRCEDEWGPDFQYMRIRSSRGNEDAPIAQGINGCKRTVHVRRFSVSIFYEFDGEIEAGAANIADEFIFLL